MDLTPLPNPLPPHIWCDFNACGWSGNTDDNCYYVLDFSELASLNPAEGMEILVFDWEDEDQTNIIGRVASLEKTNGGWRARPRGEFYSGPAPW